MEPIRVAYNRIRCCADSIPDLFWPIKTKVSQAAIKRQTRTVIEKEAVDNIPGDQLAPSNQKMNEIERQTQKEVQRNLQADLQDDNKGKEAETERAPVSMTWRSRLRPRNTGVDA